MTSIGNAGTRRALPEEFIPQISKEDPSLKDSFVPINLRTLKSAPLCR